MSDCQSTEKPTTEKPTTEKSTDKKSLQTYYNSFRMKRLGKDQDVPDELKALKKFYEKIVRKIARDICQMLGLKDEKFIKIIEGAFTPFWELHITGVWSMVNKNDIDEVCERVGKNGEECKYRSKMGNLDFLITAFEMFSNRDVFVASGIFTDRTVYTVQEEMSNEVKKFAVKMGDGKRFTPHFTLFKTDILYKKYSDYLDEPENVSLEHNRFLNDGFFTSMIMAAVNTSKNLEMIREFKVPLTTMLTAIW